MKHIYKLSIVLLSVFTFIGCNVDDDEQVMVLPQKSITASLANQNDIIAISDDATSYDLVINFSEGLPSYSTVEYSLDGGNSMTSSASSGDNSITISVAFATDDVFHDVDLSDFIVVNASARRFLPSLDGNTSVRIMRQGYFSAKLTWETGQDLDLILGGLDALWGNPFAIDDSQGVINEENVFGTALTDGNYGLFVYEWPTNTFSNPVDLTFDIVTAGGNFTFTVNAEDLGFHIWCTKSTDGNGNVSWTMYTANPS